MFLRLRRPVYLVVLGRSEGYPSAEQDMAHLCFKDDHQGTGWRRSAACHAWFTSAPGQSAATNGAAALAGESSPRFGIEDVNAVGIGSDTDACTFGYLPAAVEA